METITEAKERHDCWISCLVDISWEFQVGRIWSEILGGVSNIKLLDRPTSWSGQVYGASAAPMATGSIRTVMLSNIIALL